MNKITLKNIAIDELRVLAKNENSGYSDMSEAELKMSFKSKGKALIREYQ